jgi:S-adenosylmethionine:tRNA ribosyltransferase-isomerase
MTTLMSSLESESRVKDTPGLQPLASSPFLLPQELEAHEPPEARGLARDEVRLLVSYRPRLDSSLLPSPSSLDRLVHTTFVDLPWFLDPGDLVVVNDSATLPAALQATLPDGAEIPLHLSTRLTHDTWVVEPRPAKLPNLPTFQPSNLLSLPGGGAARLVTPHHGSARLWVAQLTLPMTAHAYLRTYGKPIRYSYVDQDWPLEAYQTVFAWHPGSAEMPSAGRPFSGRVLDALVRRGVAVESITLHTGVASAEAHEPPYEEWFEVSARTANAIAAARARGGRVVAVGTTVLRALESALDPAGRVRPTSRWTDLVITPDRPIRSASSLLTGFHEPQASHLQILEAVAGPDRLRQAYAAALEHRYLWHEFGDSHLIL